MMSCRKYDGQYIFIKLVSPQELVNLWKEKHLQLFVRISLLRAICLGCPITRKHHNHDLYHMVYASVYVVATFIPGIKL